MNICYDNINDMIKYLDMQDIYHLSLTCQEYKNLFKNKVINNINNKCKQLFNDNDKQFISLLKSTLSILSGGFLLECVLNENYNSVITLYTLSYYHYLLTPFFDRHFNWYSTDVPTSNVVQCIKTYYTKQVHNPISHDCIKIIVLKDSLQIYDKYDYILNYIKSNDYMNISKNVYYDNHLLINNINHMFNKQIIVDHNPFYHMTDYHYYQTFGFQLDKSRLYVDLTKYNIKMYYETNNYEVLDQHVYPIHPIHQFSHRHIHPNECYLKCIVTFLDSCIKHRHFKVYDPKELEIITIK